MQVKFRHLFKVAQGDARGCDFSQIKKKISEVFQLEADKKRRIEAWKKAVLKKELFDTEQQEALPYTKLDWEDQKKYFPQLSQSSDSVNQGDLPVSPGRHLSSPLRNEAAVAYMGLWCCSFWSEAF